MTAYSSKICFAILGLLIGNLLQGQVNLTGYFDPEISMGYKVTPHYSHKFALSERTYIYDEGWDVQPRQLDISHFSKLTIANTQSIALGILYRFRHPFEKREGNELRFTEQYTIYHNCWNLRFESRLRTEQRIKSVLTTHRFRYRLGLNLPLSGEELEVGEAYFLASTESLLSVARDLSPKYDQRLTAHIGWLLNKETQLEAGVEYRTENYIQETEKVLFLLTSLVFSL